MTARAIFYLTVLFLGGALAHSSGADNPTRLLELALPISAILVAVASALALSAALWLVWTFLDQLSGRTQLAFTIVEGIVNPDDNGQPKLPEVRSVGGKLPFRLAELYGMPNFRLVQTLIRAIGAPCRLLFNCGLREH